MDLEQNQNPNNNLNGGNGVKPPGMQIQANEVNKVNIQLQLQKKIQNYSISSNLIGKGGYGAVFYAVDDNTQELRAAKIFNSSYMESKQHIKYLMQEKKILSSINHPNIVRLYDVFMTKTNVYFIMEISFEGDLARYLYQNKGRLPEQRSLELFCDIVEGFRCLTSLGIIHRDIKPDNILLFQGRAKIADFGFARFLKNKDEKIQSLTPLGTPLFASPQVIKGEKFSAKTDVYSTGVLLYQMLYGTLPYMAGGPVELLNMMETRPLSFPPNDPNQELIVSDSVKELLRMMLAKDDESRIGWNQIFQLDFVQAYHKKNYSESNNEHIQNLILQKQQIQEQQRLLNLQRQQQLQQQHQLQLQQQQLQQQQQMLYQQQQQYQGLQQAQPNQQFPPQQAQPIQQQQQPYLINQQQQQIPLQQQQQLLQQQQLQYHNQMLSPNNGHPIIQQSPDFESQEYFN